MVKQSGPRGVSRCEYLALSRALLCPLHPPLAPKGAESFPGEVPGIRRPSPPLSPSCPECTTLAQDRTMYDLHGLVAPMQIRDSYESAAESILELPFTFMSFSRFPLPYGPSTSFPLFCRTRLNDAVVHAPKTAGPARHAN